MKKKALALMVVAVGFTFAPACSDEHEHANRTVVLTGDEFVLEEPGDDGLLCQTFANPFGGEADVIGWASRAREGGHHVLVYVKDNAVDSPAVRCENPPFENVVFGSQASDEEVHLPEGVGTRIRADQGFILRAHFHNATEGPLTLQNNFELTVAPPGHVKRFTGRFLFTQGGGINIPKGSTLTTVTQQAMISKDVEFVAANGHVHNYARRFSAQVGGQVIYDSTNWHQLPEQVFDPPHPIAAGEMLSFTCSYVGDPDRDVTWGQSLTKDEMCAFEGIYVVASGEPPGYLGPRISGGMMMPGGGPPAP